MAGLYCLSHYQLLVLTVKAGKATITNFGNGVKSKPVLYIVRESQEAQELNQKAWQPSREIQAYKFPRHVPLGLTSIRSSSSLPVFIKHLSLLVDSKRNILLNLVLIKLRVSEVDFNSNAEGHKPSRYNKVNTSHISIKINKQNTASTQSIPHVPSQAPPSPFKAIDST